MGRVLECWGADDVRRLRAKLHWPRAKLAWKLRVSVESVRHWETGRRVPSPPVEVLLGLLDAGLDFDTVLSTPKNEGAD